MAKGDKQRIEALAEEWGMDLRLRNVSQFLGKCEIHMGRGVLHLGDRIRREIRDVEEIQYAGSLADFLEKSREMGQENP